MMGGGLLLFILVLVGVGYVAYRLGQDRLGHDRPNGPASEQAAPVHRDEALEAVRRRYAEGEIEREEFERLRRDLG